MLLDWIYLLFWQEKRIMFKIKLSWIEWNVYADRLDRDVEIF